MTDCDVFVRQPLPTMEPIGSQVTLTCQVKEGYRISWSITLHGEVVPSSTDSPADLAFLNTNHGIVSALSTAFNREPPLQVNGLMSNDNVTVQCIAITVAKPTRKCPGSDIVLRFYGKTQRLWETLISFCTLPRSTPTTC
jgi:hypothetical protein